MLRLFAKITGMDEATQKFRKVIADVKTAQINTLADDANEIAREIESRAPRGPTGELAVSVEARQKAERYWIIIAGNATTVNIATSYNYARAVEFGTMNMAAEPFFFNTYRRLKKWHRKQMNSAAKAAIQANLT